MRGRGLIVALACSAAAAGCTAGGGAPGGVGGGFDGTYAGPFILDASVSTFDCPATDTGQAVMVVRGGQARVDVAQAAYFSGRVGANGDLVLFSGQGRMAYINGRIAGGTYVASGNANCQYQVRLTRTAPPR